MNTTLRSLLMFVLVLPLAGCAGYQQFASGYTRTYSIGYTDSTGRMLNTGATFSPIGSSHMPATKGFSK